MLHTIINTKTGVNEVFEDLAAAQAFASQQDEPGAWASHQGGVIAPLDLGIPETPADATPAAEVVAPVVKAAPAKRAAKAK